MRGSSRSVLLMVLIGVLAGCGKKAASPRDASPPLAAIKPDGATPLPGDAAVLPGDATMVRGPNSYVIVSGALRVAVAITLPVGWHDLSTEAGVALQTAGHSRFEISVQPGDGAIGADEPRRFWQDRVIATADGSWILHCRVEVSDDDAGKLAEMAEQCADLRFEQIPDPRVTWAITVTPATIALADVESVDVAIAVTNLAAETIEPHRDPLDLTIDGVSSMQLGMAFGNGGRGRQWSELAPGATARDRRTGIELVDRPGDHVVAISRYGVELARTTLHVTP